MSRKYEAEQTKLEVKIRELEEQNRAKSDEEENAEQFAKLIKNYKGVEELSASLLNRLIEKITIGEKKNRITCSKRSLTRRLCMWMGRRQR